MILMRMYYGMTGTERNQRSHLKNVNDRIYYLHLSIKFILCSIAQRVNRCDQHRKPPGTNFYK